MCVVFYMPAHIEVLYICMCSQNAPPPGLCAPGQRRTPMHTRVNTLMHTRVNTAVCARSRARAEAMCCRSISTRWQRFPLPEEGICIWPDSASAF